MSRQAGRTLFTVTDGGARFNEMNSFQAKHWLEWPHRKYLREGFERRGRSGPAADDAVAGSHDLRPPDGG